MPAASVTTGAIRKILQALGRGTSQKKTLEALAKLGAKAGNVLQAGGGKRTPLNNLAILKSARLVASTEGQATLGRASPTKLEEFVRAIGDPEQRERGLKVAANFSRKTSVPPPKAPSTGPKPPKAARPQRRAGAGALPQEDRDVAARGILSARGLTAGAATEAIKRRFGLGSLAIAGGLGFGVRGLFGGQGKRDSQAQTSALVAQLLANQTGTNRQGLVNAQEEKTRLQAALLALKIIEQQKQTAPQTIPFS